MSSVPDYGREWRELVPPLYPEGDYVAVFCDKCGGKNRQNHGWRFRDDRSDPVFMLRYAQQKAQLAKFSVILGDEIEFQELTYQCDDCRDDKNDTIAKRTRSKAKIDEVDEEHDDGEDDVEDKSSAKRSSSRNKVNR
jgi:hypothetical protein